MVKHPPAYQMVYSELKQKILDGEYAIGSFLPTEAEFIETLGVSRTTLRRALEMLSREGFLRSTAGRGTEVMDFRTRQSLNTITSISETLQRKGMQVRSKSLYIDQIQADAKLASELAVAEGTEITRVQRIQLANEIPVAIMKNYLIAALVPDMAKRMTIDQSLYLFMERQYGITIEKALDRISARAASFTDAEILGVPVGEPLIAFARICYSLGRPVCADHVSIVGKYYEFELTLSGRTSYQE